MAYGPSGNADESSSRLEEQAIARRADREACVAGVAFANRVPGFASAIASLLRIVSNPRMTAVTAASPPRLVHHQCPFQQQSKTECHEGDSTEQPYWAFAQPHPDLPGDRTWGKWLAGGCDQYLSDSELRGRRRSSTEPVEPENFSTALHARQSVTSPWARTSSTIW